MCDPVPLTRPDPDLHPWAALPSQPQPVPREVPYARAAQVPPATLLLDGVVGPWLVSPQGAPSLCSTYTSISPVTLIALFLVTNT